MIKTSISIPDDIYEKAKETTDNFSLLVSEALKEYLRKKISRRLYLLLVNGKRGIRMVLRL